MHSDPATLLEMSLTIMRMLDGNGVWVLVLVTDQWFLHLSGFSLVIDIPISSR
jgi:hypothetical protein